MPSSKISEFDLDSSVFDGMGSNEDLEEIKSSINIIDTNVDNVKANISDIKGTVNTINTNLNTVDSTVDTINSNVISMSNILNDIQSNNSSILYEYTSGSTVLLTLISSQLSFSSYEGSYIHSAILCNGFGTITINATLKAASTSDYVRLYYYKYNGTGSYGTKVTSTSYTTVSTNIPVSRGDILYIGFDTKYSNTNSYCKLLTISANAKEIKTI